MADAYSNNLYRGSPIVFFKIVSFCRPLLALGITRAHILVSVGLRKWGRNISVNLPWFVLLYYAYARFITNLKFNDFLNKKRKIII